jgi:hypothetical protein
MGTVLTVSLTLVLWQPIHTILHESSHAVVAKYYGVEITNFKPYPHYARNGFYFGSVDYVDIQGDRYIRNISAAPYILDAFMISVGEIYYFRNQIDTRIEQSMMSILVVAPMIDIACNMIGYLRGNNSDFKFIIGGKF